MFQNSMQQNGLLPGNGYSGNLCTRQYNVALSQFRSNLLKGRLVRLSNRVLRRRSHLYDLETLKTQLSVRGSSYSGIRVVRISSIIGSEGRSADFDLDFRPISEAGRERWVNMAIVQLSRIPLPPIQLIRIGEAYFVRDGHHRISVSRAFGQIAMDAEVITWNAAPPYPWQKLTVTQPVCRLEPADLSL
jgi:hypothetical protein